MPEFGLSTYLSSSLGAEAALPSGRAAETLVFVSLHMSEEFSDDYRERAETACRRLREAGYRVIADVSQKTVSQFGEPDLVRLAEHLGLWALRVDYGFTAEEIGRLAEQMPVAVNASTLSLASAQAIAKHGELVLAMHNFYPRPETGLDDAFFQARNEALWEAGLKVLAFIPGDSLLRGPVFEGLPTLERHRGLPPSACYADLALRFGVDGIVVGDPGVSDRELGRIRRFRETGVLELPAVLDEPHHSLYGKVFTNRPDSPARVVRFAESREYSCFGERVVPANCAERARGSITVDNERYGRYSGELQLIREDLPADSRVNVIGHVREDYLLIADLIPHGGKFVLTPD